MGLRRSTSTRRTHASSQVRHQLWQDAFAVVTMLLERRVTVDYWSGVLLDVACFSTKALCCFILIITFLRAGSTFLNQAVVSLRAGSTDCELRMYAVAAGNSAAAGADGDAAASTSRGALLETRGSVRRRAQDRAALVRYDANGGLLLVQSAGKQVGREGAMYRCLGLARRFKLELELMHASR